MTGSQAEMTVGVVVERRKLDSRWADYGWRTVAVLPGDPHHAPGDVLFAADGITRFFAGVLTVELYRKTTGSYRDNLATGQPKVFVVLRPDDSGPLPYRPVLATAAPDEAQIYSDNGEDLVDGVPMPEPMIPWLDAFVAEHHVDEPFYKRQRKPYDPRKGDPRKGPAPGSGERGQP